MTIDSYLLENAGLVNHARSYRRAIRDSVYGLAGVPATGGQLTVTQRAASANMSVDVASGSAYIPSTSPTHGFYHLHSDAVTNVAIAAANATNPRWDIIVARARDVEYGDGSNSLTIEVVTGTAAASPVVPATPARCLKLADVRVNAGVISIVNANITATATAAGLYQTAAAATSGGYTFTPVSVFTKVNFGAEVYDAGSNYTPGASHSYTVPSSGIYSVKARVSMAVNANAPQYAVLGAFRSGTEVDRAEESWQFPAGLPPSTPASLVLNSELFCFAAMTLDVRLFQAGPSPVNLISGSLSIRRVA